MFKKLRKLILILKFLTLVLVIVSGSINDIVGSFKELPGGRAMISGISCESCEQIIEFAKNQELEIMWMSKEYNEEEVLKKLISLCDKAGAGTKPVCTGLVNMNMPLVLSIMAEKNLDHCAVCKTVMENHGCCGGGPAVSWSLDLEKYGPKPADCSQIAIPDGGTVKKVGHITDLHWDEKYIVGSTNKCKEPICCRWGGDMPDDRNKQAGIFGSYRACDIPLKTLETTLQNMKDQHDSEMLFIIVTGDFVAHDIWETTQEAVIHNIQKQTEVINKYFPDKPIFYTPGNHDMHPTNLFADPQKKDYTNWLYELFVEQWTKSLDDNARGTIEKGGFYTFRLEDGPRIISLNSMYCYTLNWWLIYDPVDPAGQLMWLADTLAEAEKNREMVYIIQHISVGTPDCLREYSNQFWRILTRFQCVIKGLFTGHVHLDETRLVYDMDDLAKPIIPVHNGGSVTTFEDVNVNYKIYEVDTTSWEVLNAQSWVFDLQKTLDKADWYQLYSFKDEFNIPSMKPVDLDQAVQQLAQNKDLMKKYNEFYAKGSKKEMWADCDDECLRSRLCDIVTTNYANVKKCKHLPTWLDD